MNKLQKQMIALYIIGIVACVVAVALIFTGNMTFLSGAFIAAAIVVVEVGTRRIKKIRKNTI